MEKYTHALCSIQIQTKWGCGDSQKLPFVGKLGVFLNVQTCKVIDYFCRNLHENRFDIAAVLLKIYSMKIILTQNIRLIFIFTRVSLTCSVYLFVDFNLAYMFVPN